MDVELGHQACRVPVDCIYTDVHGACDFLLGHSAGEVTQYLHLALGQRRHTGPRAGGESRALGIDHDSGLHFG